MAEVRFIVRCKSTINLQSPFRHLTSSECLLTPDPNLLDTPCVTDIVERIRAEDQYVCRRTWRQRTNRAGLPVAARRIARGRHERLHRREAGVHHHLELQVL